MICSIHIFSDKQYVLYKLGSGFSKHRARSSCAVDFQLRGQVHGELTRNDGCSFLLSKPGWLRFTNQKSVPTDGALCLCPFICLSLKAGEMRVFYL